jgi:hypothetical protein
MCADSSRSFPHQVLWRKLRRRYYLDGFAVFGGMFVLPPALCGVAWLCHGPISRWLTFGFGILWFLTCTFMMLAMSLSLIATRRQGKILPLMRFTLLWYILVNASTMIVLLIGRVDAAIYLSFGLLGLSGLWSGRASVRNTVLPLMAALALCLGFAAHSVWLVIPLLLLHYLQPWRVRPSLLEEMRRRPTRMEYLARSREQCAAGAG